MATTSLFHALWNQSVRIWDKEICLIYIIKNIYISSYSLSYPLERAFLPPADKHFDTSFLKITRGVEGWNKMNLRGFTGGECKKKRNWDFLKIFLMC